MKKKFLLAIALFFTLMPIRSFAAEDFLRPIGGECERDPQCQSGDCESATNGKDYCVCNDEENSVDCRTNYGGQNNETWTCVDGGDASYDLHYCASNLPGNNKYPIPPGKASTWDILTDSNLAGDEIKTITSKPSLKINIPGLHFSDPTVVEKDGGAFIVFPIIGEYIAAVYRYGIIAAGILAVVMIINAGFLWSRDGGNSQVVAKQKESIEKAVIGLIIAVASYTILFFINPKLTEFSSLNVQYIKPITISVDSAGEPATSGPSSPLPGSGNVPYFAQWKGPWADKKPGDPEWPFDVKAGATCTTIQKRGCGPTSLAMVLSYYGENVTPLDTGRWALGCTGAWQAYATLPDFSKRWPSLQMQLFTKKNLEKTKLRGQILTLLQNKKPLIYNCAPCQGFKSDGQPSKEYKGHYVVLTGLLTTQSAGLSDDKIFLTINDPGRNEKERIETMTLQQVLDNLIIIAYVDRK